MLVEGDGEFNQEAGRKAMSNILPAYPKIDAVFTHDDEAAVGALTEIRSAKRTDIQFITGMGGSKSAFALMAKKDPLYEFTNAVTNQQAARVMYRAWAKQLVKALDESRQR